MLLVELRVNDRRMLKLLRKWLEAGVMEGAEFVQSELGTPQGGVISPLLANVYLHYLDKLWERHYRHLGTLVRYADDAVILCRSQRAAKEALQRLWHILRRLELQLHPEKTRLANLQQGREGFDFLGFHHRKVWSVRYRRFYLLQWPSRKAMKAMRAKVKAVTSPRERLKWPLGKLVKQLNYKIPGWGAYHGRGASTRHFSQIDAYIEERLVLFLHKKHQKADRHRWKSYDAEFFRRIGLKRLSGRVWWHRANAPGEGRRKAV